MRPMKMAAAAFAAVLTMSAALVANASAAVPEFGRCVPATTPKTGEYAGAHCTRPAGGKGSYNFIPGPGEHPKFEGTNSLVVVLEMPKLTISCAAETFNGEYTGAKTVSVTVDFIGCVNAATERKCQSNPAKEGEIEPPGTLEGEIGLIKVGSKTAVGLDVKRAPVIATFTCGEFGEVPEVTGVIEGSVIGKIAPINSMHEEFKLQYKAAEGKQVPESFEGGAKDTLTVQLVSGLGSTTEAAVLKEKRIEILNEEAIEIKAK
jgi:hypothetical protein